MRKGREEHLSSRARSPSVTLDEPSKKKTIGTPDDITPEWLTAVLSNTGATVRAVSVILSKELPVSTVHRLAIDYYAPSVSAPETLFLKLGKPMQDEPTEITRPEVEFYQTIARVIGCPPLIRCYDVAFDEESGRSHVLMEDLSETHGQPEQHTTPSEEMSRCAVQALAKVHASLWSSPELGSTVGKRFTDEWLANFLENLEKNVTEFLDVARVSTKQKEAYAEMLKSAPRVWGRLLDTNVLTVTHGDLHWWNFLYPKDEAKDSVRLFDWQLWHIDLGARDLAFLLALGGFAEPRPSLEERLLRAYHDALGVPDYSWEMLMHDYRMSAIRNLNIPVIFWKQGKHYWTWQDALRRALDSYERLGCRELVR